VTKASSRLHPPYYLDWLRSEATLIDTDGCSNVTGFNVVCCLEHDCAFHYGRDPRDAYRKHLDGSFHPWVDAAPITFNETNRRFKRCHQAYSKFGQYSPFAFWRFLGVQWFSKGVWDRHRKDRP
jgi:hypothetical protein